MADNRAGIADTGRVAVVERVALVEIPLSSAKSSLLAAAVVG